MKKVLTALLLTMGFAAGQTMPDIPMTPELINYLDSKDVIELTPEGFTVAGSVPIPGSPLAKRACCTSALRFIKRNTVDRGGDIMDYAIDGANVVVSTTTDGVKWVVDKGTDGVTFVVEQTIDGTKWTLNTAIDGTQTILSQTANGLAWAITAPLPDGVSIPGYRYVRLDRTKNIIRAGIRLPVKVLNEGTDATQDGLDYLLDASKAYAVGTIEIVDGVTYIAMDIATFAVSNGLDISQSLLTLDVDGAYRKVFSTVRAAVTNVLNWGDLGICGSMEGMKNTLYTNTVIADYWPPDESITNLLSVQAQGCRIVGLARVYKGCQIHDHCYSVPGKPKKECDDEILKNWYDACVDAYRGKSGYCLSNCRKNQDIFHKIMVGGSQLAYDAAQEASRNNPNLATSMTDKYNYYKNKYMQQGSNEYAGNTKPKPADYVARPFIYPFVDMSPKQLSAVLALLNG